MLKFYYYQSINGKDGLMAMETAAVRKVTTWMSVLSILPHIFCCGIPAAMAIISLGTTVGLAGVLATNPFYRFVDAYHPVLIGIAVSAVVLSGIFNLIAYRMDCKAAAASCCGHEDCKPKKSQSLKVFVLSLVLLSLDLGWFFTEEDVLGLHHGGHHEVSAAQ